VPGGRPGPEQAEYRRSGPDDVEQSDRSAQADTATGWLEPDEATAQRTIAVCYARHRPLTATARTLITAIRSQAAWALSAPTARSGR
jgi:hypothetical protein